MSGVIQLPDLVEGALPGTPSASPSPQSPSVTIHHVALPLRSFLPRPPTHTLSLQDQHLRLLLSKHHPRLADQASVARQAKHNPPELQGYTSGSRVSLAQDLQGGALGPAPANLPHLQPSPRLRGCSSRHPEALLCRPLVGHPGQDSRWPGQSVGSQCQDGNVGWQVCWGRWMKREGPETQKDRDRAK